MHIVRETTGKYYEPRASVNLDSHADGSSVMAVREEAQLAGDQHRIQFAFLCNVRVCISRDYLNETSKLKCKIMNKMTSQ